jgi:hypothetical protein
MWSTMAAAAGRREEPSRDYTCNNTLLCPDLRSKRITPILTRVTARSPDNYRS